MFLICHCVLLLFECDALIIEEYGHIRKWGHLVLSSAASKSHCSKYIGLYSWLVWLLIGLWFVHS